VINREPREIRPREKKGMRRERVGSIIEDVISFGLPRNYGVSEGCLGKQS
jgi:hypothetical protein